MPTALVPPNQCPYPGIGHSFGAQVGVQVCEGCNQPLLYCSRCGAANRALSRFCRQCGTARPDARWSTRGGEADGALLTLSVPAQTTPQVKWEATLDEPVGTSPLVCSGLLLTLSTGGQLTVFRERSAIPIHASKLDLPHLLASPVLVDSLLVAASGSRIQVVDLAALLGISPDTPARDRTLQIPGTVASHLVSDGRERVLLASVDGTRLYLHCLATAPGQGLQLLWSRPLSSTAQADAFHALAFLGDGVVLGEPGGHIWSLSADGKVWGEDDIGKFMAPLPWLTRQQGVLLAAADGQIFRLDHPQALSRMSLLEPSDRPLYAFGASDSHLVACYGRVVVYVRMATTVATRFELPQTCSLDPLVVAGTAALLSDDGSIYLLDLTSGSGYVRWTQRLFTSPGTMPAPPVATPRSLFACGPAGEVTAVGWMG